ncbi:MAG: thioredoxin family protein [Flavobacteriaceae bacterium]|nr:thioredoxin family protein [Flavobacteriaceae bacterium]
MKNTTTTLPTILFFLFANITLVAQQRIEQSEELGQVHWYRDYDKALAVAAKEDKDVLLLFQEVPGCSTCRNYGHNVLSHPLMVEAIESLLYRWRFSIIKEEKTKRF